MEAQIRSHCYNTSYDPEKGSWSALELGIENYGPHREIGRKLYGPDCAEKQKKSSSRRRYIAQIVASFGVTWIVLNAIIARYSAPLSQAGSISPQASNWKSAFLSIWAQGNHDLTLHPLSSRATAIKDRCQSLPPFPDDVYRTRIKRVQDQLQRIHEERATGTDSTKTSAGEIYVLEPSASSMYYTGIGSKEWHASERPFLFLIEFQKGERLGESTTILSILTPAFEASRAKLLNFPGMDKSTEVEFIEWKEEEDWAQVFVQHLEQQKDPTVQGQATFNLHFDPAVRSFIPAAIAHALAKQGLQPDSDFSMDVADPRILSVRERKSVEEIAVLKCANELTLEAIRATKDTMFFGIKESQTANVLSRYFEELGMPGGEGLVLFGGEGFPLTENAALPHGTGSDRALRKEDFALIDAGGQFRGYTSDITRTFALSGSKISATQDRLWNLVKEAQTAALRAGVVGATGQEVDAAAREIIEAKGKRQAEREGFTHRLGHGIGLEGHESPYLVGSNARSIEKGNVFSDEPGIYIPGEIGVRLEDCWYVNAEGQGELLTEQAKDFWTL
ncbi:hypothetical protein QFC19_007117 [Naganishia cerealis]|uniref:Uncharacterized protein n=1 Tax=Naganishia cerealis TaxID=610337 RepID=A0ACC2VCE6_9TREE|nr:hypothetical protein QFC19_007117 [Naganishia cerealis]